MGEAISHFLSLMNRWKYLVTVAGKAEGKGQERVKKERLPGLLLYDICHGRVMTLIPSGQSAAGNRVRTSKETIF